MNIKFYNTLIGIGFLVAFGLAMADPHPVTDEDTFVVPVKACVVKKDTALNDLSRLQIAQCLGWQTGGASYPSCRASYRIAPLSPIADPNAIQVSADKVSFYAHGRSMVKGHVVVRQSQGMLNADTAYIYYDTKTNKIKKIELLGGIRYYEPGRLMYARKATMHPRDKSGRIEDVLYQFETSYAGAILPAWGQAHLVERFPNQDYRLRKATYTTCAPKDKAWQIEADEITLSHSKEEGVAKHAVLRMGDLPVLYAPHLTFPTSKKRKSGFLMPIFGYSNVGGGDVAAPYYWNMAPNYDATIIPHLYTRRGAMLGGEFRFLTERSTGMFTGNFLPDDQAFRRFVAGNQTQYPSLRGVSSNRWSVLLNESTAFTDNFHMNVNYQQVSDDYYLQDFSTNLAVATTNQLLRQGELVYTTDHWLFRGLAQSYQTLRPINQSLISEIYQRMPQLAANASYTDLPMNATFTMVNEFDYFQWSGRNLSQPKGSRYHVNPILSLPMLQTWGYITPSVQLVENYYDVHYVGEIQTNSFNRTIPRLSVDSGLSFERKTAFMGRSFTQILEPRLFYLNVPYRDQTSIPVYDSAYMIFSYEQLFRTNRFSGFDRIGDGNQLTYALKSRWLSESSGEEKASLAFGQIGYFANRKVQLCYQRNGTCTDTPLFLGYVSPLAKTSPIASHAMYALNPTWVISGDYVWDPYTRGTNNANVNFHYKPEVNHIVNFEYTYLVNGNLILAPRYGVREQSPLHQATVSFAWPLTERWSSLGAYSYNISKRYDMLTFLGFQYDTCCWAVRLLGGRSFKSVSSRTFAPQYNNNAYIQFLLKGLGSVGNSIPASTIKSYLPGYKNEF